MTVPDVQVNEGYRKKSPGKPAGSRLSMLNVAIDSVEWTHRTDGELISQDLDDTMDALQTHIERFFTPVDASIDAVDQESTECCPDPQSACSACPKGEPLKDNQDAGVQGDDLDNEINSLQTRLNTLKTWRHIKGSYLENKGLSLNSDQVDDLMNLIAFLSDELEEDDRPGSFLA